MTGRFKSRASLPSIERLIRLAAIAALVGLALMLWPIADARPIPVFVAMTVGQAVGTLSLVMFLLAIVLDLRRANVLRDTRDGHGAPPTESEEPEAAPARDPESER